MTAEREAPTIEVLAPDGAVLLWLPPNPSAPRRAQVWQHDTPTTIEVAWQRQPGFPSTYVCARHGTSARYDHCKHTLAAIRAASEYEKEHN